MLSRREKLSSAYRFTAPEKLLLETVFTYNHCPDQTKIQEIADKLAVSAKKVQNWFNYRRFLWKQKETQARSLQRKYFNSYMYTYFFHNSANHIYHFHIHIIVCLHTCTKDNL